MYIPPPNLTNVFITLAVVVGCYGAVWRELNPATRLGYSKFVTHQGRQIPSRTGMLLIYSPSAIVSILLCVYAKRLGLAHNVLLVTFFDSLHYLKRVYEVIYVHKYSGSTRIGDVSLISIGYAAYAVAMFELAASVPANSCALDQVVLGITLFSIGQLTNYYHHLLLSKLRHHGSKEYKIPRDGLFCYVWCPHYLGEIISFLGMALISQHLFALGFQLGSAAYLCVRARNTRTWYEEKFPDAPRKASLVPQLF